MERVEVGAFCRAGRVSNACSWGLVAFVFRCSQACTDRTRKGTDPQVLAIGVTT